MKADAAPVKYLLRLNAFRVVKREGSPQFLGACHVPDQRLSLPVLLECSQAPSETGGIGSQMGKEGGVRGLVQSHSAHRWEKGAWSPQACWAFKSTGRQPC